MNLLNGHELPINKQAAFSYSKGEEYKLKACQLPTVQRFFNRPPTDKFNGPKIHNLTGTTLLNLLVIGYINVPKTQAGTLWVVKCICGNYEVRRSKSIKKSIKNMYDSRCSICENKENRKRHYEYITKGFNLSECNTDYY